MALNNKKLLVVIHIITDYDDKLSIEERTLNQIKIAFNNNADGVFLTIGEGNLSPEIIIKCYNLARNTYPTKFIGINFMCDYKKACELIPQDANAIWIDKGLGSKNYYEEINICKDILKNRNWKGLYFGGFCLKGNNQTLFENTNLFESLNWEPEKYFDVCVTSGISTGIPIEIHNLKIVKNKSNNVKIGLASGVNLNNVSEFIKYTDYFIVGTGVEKSSDDKNIINFYKEAGLPEPVMVGYLDGSKIYNLANKIHNYN